jgi:hypothetical protein
MVSDLPLLCNKRILCSLLGVDGKTSGVSPFIDVVTGE